MGMLGVQMPTQGEQQPAPEVKKPKETDVLKGLLGP